MKLESLRAVAKDTSLSIHTLRKLCREGMPHYRVGRKILINRAEFDSWFAARFRPAASEADLDSIVGEALARLK